MRAITSDLTQLKSRHIEDAGRQHMKLRVWSTWGGPGYDLRLTSENLRHRVHKGVAATNQSIRTELKDLARN